jgi:hypothetical protein
MYLLWGVQKNIKHDKILKIEILAIFFLYSNMCNFHKN